MRRWNLDNAQAIQQINHGGPVTSVAVDRLGERIASASDNHTARLFREDGQQIAEMRGDIRRRVAQTRAQQQLDAANARLALVKQLLQQAEQDLPVKTTAEQTLTASLAAANTDVTAKQAALEKAKADKTAAEAAAITASTNSKNAQAAKETAELAAKVAATAMQTAQATMQRLQQSAATDPKNEELKKLVATAMQDLATCQQKSDAATAAIAAPTQTAQQMATLANDAALKVNQMQKPFTDAAAALKVSQMNQNLLSQQQALAAKELKTATDLVPLRKDSVTRAEAAQAAAQQVVTASGTSATEADLAIRSVAFSPDGQSILTAGDFVNAHLWDGRTGGGVGAFAGHTAKINSALFVDEGRFVTISGDQTVRCWEVNPDWKLERVIGSVEDPNQIIHRVTALDFTADSSHVLVAGGVPSRTGELAIFRVADGARTLHVPQAHTDAIYSARLSPTARASPREVRINTCGRSMSLRLNSCGDSKGTRIMSWESTGRETARRLSAREQTTWSRSGMPSPPTRSWRSKISSRDTSRRFSTSAKLTVSSPVAATSWSACIMLRMAVWNGISGRSSRGLTAWPVRRIAVPWWLGMLKEACWSGMVRPGSGFEPSGRLNGRKRRPNDETRSPQNRGQNHDSVLLESADTLGYPLVVADLRMPFLLRQSSP